MYLASCYGVQYMIKRLKIQNSSFSKMSLVIQKNQKTGFLQFNPVFCQSLPIESVFHCFFGSHSWGCTGLALWTN